MHEMKLIITYPSALEYWLEEKGIPPFYQCPSLYSASFDSRKDLARAAEYLRFSHPVHLVVHETVTRRGSDSISYHQLPKVLPEGSFIEITDSISIISPEMCFLQAATQLSLPELVFLACELCSIYVKDLNSDYYHRRREPITSVEAISAFLNKAKGARGVNLAKRAIKYAVNNSNSPMESCLATLACLPFCYGGYGLPKPQLNLDVSLPPESKAILQKNTCCCDFVWLKEKVIVEYDSNLSHLSAAQHHKDKKRVTALSLAGYTVIIITAVQLQRFRDIEAAFFSVRKALKLHPHSSRADQHFQKRWDTAKKLLPKGLAL